MLSLLFSMIIIALYAEIFNLHGYRGLNVVHVALDKDMLQLVEDGVHVSKFDLFACTTVSI